MVSIGEVKEHIISSHRLMTFKGHFHPEWEELLICLQGVTGVRVGEDKEFFLYPDEGLLLEPGEKHLMWDASEDKNTCYYNAYYAGYLPLFRQRVNTLFDTKNLKTYPFWRDVLPGIKSQEKRIYQVLTLLLALHGEGSGLDKLVLKIDRKDRIQPQTLEDNFLNQLSQIIQRELGKNHSLTELGEIFFLAPKYLSQKAKKITGLSIMTIYFRIKMEIAGELLSAGASVKSTAYTLGFKNPYHFSRKFKEITGVTPSLYRFG